MFITDICNLSISFNKFPSAFKLAKVKPIFKKGRKTNVSLLPFRRSLKKLFTNKQLTLITFSININLALKVTIQQTYFYHFSVTTFLKGFDKGMYTGMILIDLQKTFDEINHKILLDKLCPIGFSKNTISWCKSYLAERHFTVEVANRVSKFASIPCGVPQGSILGPLLFLFMLMIWAKL